jgi:hypothetical protein
VARRSSLEEPHRSCPNYERRATNHGAVLI